MKRWRLRLVLGIASLILVIALGAFAAGRPSREGQTQANDNMDYADKGIVSASAEVTTVTTTVVAAAPAAGFNRYIKSVMISMSSGSGASTDTRCSLNIGTGNLMLVYAAGGASQTLLFDGRGFRANTTFNTVAMDGSVSCQVQSTTLGAARCFCSVIYADEVL